MSDLADTLKEIDRLRKKWEKDDDLDGNTDVFAFALFRIADPFTGHAPGTLEPGESGSQDIALNALKKVLDR